MTPRRLTILIACGLFLAPPAGFSQANVAVGTPPALSRPREAGFRLLSWNVSGLDFAKHASVHRSMFRLLDPDILLLDEVQGGTTAAQIAAVVRGLRGTTDTTWRMVISAGGGRQRGVVLSRHPLSPVPAFSRLPYPAAALAE